MSELVRVITASDPAIRDRPLDPFCHAASLSDLLRECTALDDFRRSSSNLYECVRALFFLYAIHRFHIPAKHGAAVTGLIPFDGAEHLFQRRFEEAIRTFAAAQQAAGPSQPISSALAAAYRGLGFQRLADQVRRSVRSVRGNQWMFRTGHPADYPLRLVPELTSPDAASGLFPVLHESTPVRMDLSHSGWSDIFFLGMDYPEGARVLNVSIDLAVRGTPDAAAHPPIEAWLRVIDQPVLRLSSVDLGASADVTSLAEVFDFARDYLGLLKAAVIAAGIVPPGMEGASHSLEHLLALLTGRAGHGLELVSRVNDIPKGSRLAVSTNLLACLIAAAMRATRQTEALTGTLQESERRLVAARAILGEWLGGSGGGWQDSGGVWPGMKLIRGVAAREGDIECGVSRGCLLPSHEILSHDDVSLETRRALQDSLVLVHGGMAQDVGPILEMVTERYLLRSEAEWQARQEAGGILDRMLATLRAGDVAALGGLTHRNFEGPIQAIIPWATNAYTEALIERVAAEFGASFQGFWMLGGMAGGGMGFLFDPSAKPRALERLPVILGETKRQLQGGVPFAMEPVVYDFAINECGTQAELLASDAALLPPAYYALVAPALLRQEPRLLSPTRRGELSRFAAACKTDPKLSGLVPALFDRLMPQSDATASAEARDLDSLLAANGFDWEEHEQIRADLRLGRVGLSQNRLPASSVIEDVSPRDLREAASAQPFHRNRGREILASGGVAVVTLAGGAGTRWTRGAGVVKALHPFARLAGAHRTFLEVHLAKSRRTGRALPHVITTSYLTHAPIEEHLRSVANYGYPGPLLLSPGRSVGLRMVPMARDLRFAWEETPQQLLDVQAQKLRESLRSTLIQWAMRSGEASDYTANLALQCLHPTGHWYEVPNLLRNGTLSRLLAERPALRYLMVHNIDTLGADVDPALLGLHAESGAALSFEVIARQIDDRGGGLARVDGHIRLVEGLALPHEEIESRLSYYNSGTCWVDIDRLLEVFGLSRDSLADPEKVARGVRATAAHMPTYVTIKDVKKRWGKGQEDVFPVAQWEKLWGDMTALAGIDCRFFLVSRSRGQQLKEVAQLDGWLRDGSAAHVASLCDWT